VGETRSFVGAVAVIVPTPHARVQTAIHIDSKDFRTRSPGVWIFRAGAGLSRAQGGDRRGRVGAVRAAAGPGRAGVGDFRDRDGDRRVAAGAGRTVGVTVRAPGGACRSTRGPARTRAGDRRRWSGHPRGQHGDLRGSAGDGRGPNCGWVWAGWDPTSAIAGAPVVDFRNSLAWRPHPTSNSRGRLFRGHAHGYRNPKESRSARPPQGRRRVIEFETEDEIDALFASL
jgi:hypothetical protein